MQKLDGIMTFNRVLTTTIAFLSVSALVSCSGVGSTGGGRGIFGARSASQDQATADNAAKTQQVQLADERETSDGTSIFDLFKKKDNGTTVKVNRYLWNASLDVLSFLPVQSVDPFTGVIVTGYGTPPGGGRAYRATVFIKDPALDARSITVALASRGGTVSASTQRAVEDAILARARQMRIKAGHF